MPTLLSVRSFVVLGFLSLLSLLPVQAKAHIPIQKSESEKVAIDPEKDCIEVERRIYALWYTAYQKKDVIRTIGFAKQYVERCPTGQYASYLKRYLDKNLPEHPETLKIFEAEAMDKVVVEPARVAGKGTNKIIINNILEVPQDAVLGEGLLLAIIEDGASVDARSKSGYTALMLASLNGHVTTIKKLLEKGADINFKEASHGYTPLAFAVAMERTETVRLLLANGADRFIRDKDGRNALDQANLGGSPEIIKLLKQFPSKK